MVEEYTYVIVGASLGEIILDEDLSGQLYVKNVWVQDMKLEDLKTGVNFINLRIDRYRPHQPVVIILSQ